MLSDLEHRPYPPPTSPWAGQMVWSDLLLAHWSVPPEALRRIVPPSLVLDTYDGQAWLAITPLHMSGVRPRGVPAIPWVSAFPELNVRTYVTLGGKPGVYFFSLDVNSVAAMAGARAFYSLPYFLAQMSVTHEGSWVHYSSHRSRWHGAPAHFIGRYRPTGGVFHAAPGSLEYWLIERYCLYTTDSRNQVYRVDIHHPPWPLQPAEVAIFRNTMAAPLGLDLPEQPALAHYAQRLEVLAWLPSRVEAEVKVV